MLSWIYFIIDNVFTLFWIGLIVMLLILPAMTRRKYDKAIAAKFQKIQRQRKSKLITLVHRFESMGFIGMARLRSIDLNDAEELLQAIRETPDNKPIELMIHTPGGLVIAAVQIAKALKRHPAPVRVFIPHFAMSGGTLIALAADEIIMTEHAIMGPIDPQLGGLPAASFVRVTEKKSADAIGDRTLILADMSEMALRQVKASAREFLRGTVSENAAANIAEQLASGQWTHDYPIYASEAKELGLQVSTDMPQEIMDLMALFPEQIRRQSSIRHWPLVGPVVSAVFGEKPTEPFHDNTALSQIDSEANFDKIRPQISFGPHAGTGQRRPSGRNK